MNIYCFNCHGQHRLTKKKFPMMLFDTVKKGNTVVDRKFKGYLCKKCCIKSEVLNEMKKNDELKNIGWRKAIPLILKNRKTKGVEIGETK